MATPRIHPLGLVAVRVTFDVDGTLYTLNNWSDLTSPRLLEAGEDGQGDGAAQLHR